LPAAAAVFGRITMAPASDGVTASIAQYISLITTQTNKTSATAGK